jgi:A-macroglobulin TED domain
MKQVNAVRFNDGKVRATQYLESQLVAAAADPYALSIICYALTLANSTLADTAFQRLNSLAINKGKNTPIDSYTIFCHESFINTCSHCLC